MFAEYLIQVSLFKFTVMQWKGLKPAINVFILYFPLKIWEQHDVLLLKTVFAQLLQRVALHCI